MTNQDESSRKRTSNITEDPLEQEITLILKHLPIALTITKRDVDRYVWQWADAKGEGDSFTNALENALTHLENAYIALSHQ